MIKIDPEKRAKSVVLNPHLWSLKRRPPSSTTLLATSTTSSSPSRPRGRPRKNPLPAKVPTSPGEIFSLYEYYIIMISSK